MDCDDFYDQFKKLESIAKVPGEPTYALGAHYDNNKKNINEVMHIADKNMYRNKAEFYEANPEYDRRDR